MMSGLRVSIRFVKDPRLAKIDWQLSVNTVNRGVTGAFPILIVLFGGILSPSH